MKSVVVFGIIPAIVILITMFFVLKDPEIGKMVKFAAILYVFDLFLPDPIPYVDEIGFTIFFLLKPKGTQKFLALSGVAFELLSLFP